MLDCPNQIAIAQVDDKGLLLSGSLTGMSSLLITLQETLRVSQTLILAVKVSSSQSCCKECEFKCDMLQILTLKSTSLTSVVVI